MDTFKLHRMDVSTVLIQYDTNPSDTFLKQLLAVKEALKKTFSIEIIHSYTELLLKFEQPIANYKQLKDHIENILSAKLLKPNTKNCKHYIPVCYDAHFGKDLKGIAGSLKLTIEEVIELHILSTYTIYFTGFLPGFLYLQGLKSALHIPRKSTPELVIPKGSVAIGGSQTGIYPQTSPGGWHVLGHSPVLFFSSESQWSTPFSAGDKLMFYAINSTEHANITAAIADGTYKHLKEEIDG